MNQDNIDDLKQVIEDGLLVYWIPTGESPRHILSIEPRADEGGADCGLFGDGDCIRLDNVPPCDVLVGATVDRLETMD